MVSREQTAIFIRTTFRSAWALELLCHLMSLADQGHSHDELVTGLRASELIVRQSIETLTAAGLLSVDAEGKTRYAPASREVAELAEAAKALYAYSPDAVRRMIVSATNPSITAFADAFRLRKD